MLIEKPDRFIEQSNGWTFRWQKPTERKCRITLDQWAVSLALEALEALEEALGLDFYHLWGLQYSLQACSTIGRSCRAQAVALAKGDHKNRPYAWGGSGGRIEESYLPPGHLRLEAQRAQSTQHKPIETSLVLALQD